jgi:hypothetical protein
VELFTFILGILSGAIVAAFRDLFSDWYRRPKLVLLGDVREDGVGWSGHSVRVENAGRGPAANCQVMLTMEGAAQDDLCADEDIITLEKLGCSPDKWGFTGDETFALSQERSFRNVVNELLTWSQMGNPVQIDLYPGTSRMIDVLRVMKGPVPDRVVVPQLHVVSERGWSCLRGAFMRDRPTPKGPYSMTLTAVAANAKVSRTYVVRPRGVDDVDLVAKDETRS